VPMDAWFDGVAGEGACVYLRHDVDRFASRAAALGEAEKGIGVRSTFYVRCDADGRFPEKVIARLLAAGHCIGYHYETLARAKGDRKAALGRFGEELAALRKLAPVRSAAAHGSPLTPYDNRDLWKEASCRDFGLDGEVQEDVDYSRVLYLTDTGGRFNSEANVRDRVKGLRLERAYRVTELPGVVEPTRYPLVVLSTHPERWPAGVCGLVQAWAMDRAVNTIKRLRWVMKRAKEGGTC